MRILHIDTSADNINKILQGCKVREVREVRPKNKIYLLKHRNKKYPMYNGLHIPKYYDAIYYHSKDKSQEINILVEVKDVIIKPITLSNGQQAYYLYKDEVIGAETITYELGAILKAKQKTITNIL